MFAADGRTIAYRGPWEDGPAIQILDAATGDCIAVHTDIAALSIYATKVGLVTMDHGWRPEGRKGQRRIVALGGGSLPLGTGEHLGGVSPDRSEVFTWSTGTGTLREWPTGRVRGVRHRAGSPRPRRARPPPRAPPRPRVASDPQIGRAHV